MLDPRHLLRQMFDAAVSAASPHLHVPKALPKPPNGRTIIVGAGKASAAMASVLEQHWHGSLEGLVVTRYGHGMSCKKIEVVEASHPVPDRNGEIAAHRILEMVKGLSEDDLVIALISGGASSLLALPGVGLTLEDKQAVNGQLLRYGIPISEMNCLRKHLSAIKGGRLAAATFPARCVSLVISDVPGDDISLIGSGPTCADQSTAADALAIIDRYKLDVPSAVLEFLNSPASETPKPDDLRLSRASAILIASPQQSLEAAAKVVREAGMTPVILSDSIEGEARELGSILAGIALQVRRFGQPALAPCVLLSGGETTVTVRGNGVGGRNVEFLMSLALKLQGAEGIHALSADTDGVDGSIEVAGAIIDPTSLRRARTLGIDVEKSLASNDGHSLFKMLGDQIITGPTRTNVNDFRAILIEGTEM